MEKSIFEQIKRQNGEHFAKTIRAFDNGIFDIPNIVEIVKYAGREAEPILNYLVSLKNIRIEAITQYKDPLQLLDEAGYRAYYVHTPQQLQAIMPYFQPGEQLCSFHDETRLQRYYIINAVKKNVHEIHRCDFEGHEQREDAYGTSVISIQILKAGGFISIKNRYNHSVENPDNTFNSNPDRIITGLASALRQKFKTDFSSQQVTLPENYTIINGQIVKFHTEMGGKYIGENFYATDDEIISIDKDKELILDHWIFNIKDRTFENLAPAFYCEDAFPHVFQKETENKAIQVTKNPDHSHTILADGQSVLTEKEGEIIELNIQASTLEDSDTLNFLAHNTALRTLNMPNIRVIDNDFLFDNIHLTTLNAPRLRQVGNNFLYSNTNLHTINLPELRVVGDAFLANNPRCYEFNAPNIIKIGNDFLSKNIFLRTLSFPKLTQLGDDCMNCNQILYHFDAPKLRQIGRCFLEHNQEITELSLPVLKTVGEAFLCKNHKLTHLDVPNLSYIDSDFLSANKVMTELVLPNVRTIEDGFMAANTTLTHLDAPKLKFNKIGFDFLAKNPPAKASFMRQFSRPRDGGRS